MTARKNRVAPEDDSAMPATPNATDETPSWLRDTEQPSRSIRDEIRTSAGNGFAPGDSVPAANSVLTEPPTSTSTKTSKRSGKPSGGLNKHWRTPKDGRELAAQITLVATMVLNDEMFIEKARVYGSLVRADVQALSVEVSRARFARTIPDLTFDLTVFDEDDD